MPAVFHQGGVQAALWACLKESKYSAQAALSDTVVRCTNRHQRVSHPTDNALISGLARGTFSPGPTFEEVAFLDLSCGLTASTGLYKSILVWGT